MVLWFELFEFPFRAGARNKSVVGIESKNFVMFLRVEAKVVSKIISNYTF
jgi:hypothetical protein